MQRRRIANISGRLVSLGPGLPAIPERLLLSHAGGRVLFIAGAGVSQNSGLPDFRGLVLDVYKSVDRPVHEVISSIPAVSCNQWSVDCKGLTFRQTAEVRRFISGDYDVVLGMLERRIDGSANGSSRVRSAVVDALRSTQAAPAPIHLALMRLSDRGGASAIVTTNFDRLLEQAAARIRSPAKTYALGGIPRPGRRTDFAGILHIHGALDEDESKISDLIVSDEDFGEFYLRRRVVPDFVYDAARLFNLVLVGYSANDAPMRYLLNAVSADGSRFDDLKERFVFFGAPTRDEAVLEDWRGRGITPILYDSSRAHSFLSETLVRWAELSPQNGRRKFVDTEIRRLVRTPRSSSPEADRDLFDHLIRRSDASERIRLSRLASRHSADLSWLDAIAEIATEPDGDHRS